MDTKDPSNEDKEMRPLEFSEPEPWIDIIREYRNPKTQGLELRLRGKSPEVIWEYLKEVQVSFEVLPLAEKDFPEEAGKDEGESEEEPKELEFYTGDDLLIFMDVINTQGLQGPYVLNARVDASIAQSPPHTYKTTQNVKKINITLTATNNAVEGTLSGGGINQTIRVDTFGNSTSQPAYFSGDVERKSLFSFKVIGIASSNRYRFTSTVQMRK